MAAGETARRPGVAVTAGGGRPQPARRRPGRLGRCRSRSGGPAGSTSSARRPRCADHHPVAGAVPAYPGADLDHLAEELCPSTSPAASTGTRPAEQRQVAPQVALRRTRTIDVGGVAQLGVGHLAYRRTRRRPPSTAPHPGTTRRTSGGRPGQRGDRPVGAEHLTGLGELLGSGAGPADQQPGSSPTRWAASPGRAATPAERPSGQLGAPAAGRRAQAHLHRRRPGGAAAQASARPAAPPPAAGRRSPPASGPAGSVAVRAGPGTPGYARAAARPGQHPPPAGPARAAVPVPPVPGSRPPIVGRDRVKRARPEGVNRPGPGNRRRPGAERVVGVGPGARDTITYATNRHRGRRCWRPG